MVGEGGKGRYMVEENGRLWERVVYGAKGWSMVEESGSLW